MTTREFTREQLEAWGIPDVYDAIGPAAEQLHEEMVDTLRWSSVHAIVFRAPDDGKAWRVYFERGLTESQDGTDLWADEDFITGTEMEHRSVTRMEWLEASK